jgi:acetyl-CoA C-acetyltransferase
MNSTARRVAVLGGARIPFARQNGPYATASNQDMLTATLDALVGQFGLEGEVLGEVAAGAVLKHSRDFNLTRECVLGSQLAPETPAYDVQQACGTGLEATILVGNKIALGQIDCGIAGGVDTTSDAPLALNEDLREVLLELNRTKSNIGRLRALTKLRPQQVMPERPRNAEPRTGLSMGEHTAIMAISTRSTRPLPRRCCARSRPGRTRCSAPSAWGWTRPWGPSTGTSSTSTAARSPPVIRSAPPAAASSPPSPGR